MCSSGVMLRGVSVARMAMANRRRTDVRFLGGVSDSKSCGRIPQNCFKPELPRDIEEGRGGASSRFQLRRLGEELYDADYGFEIRMHGVVAGADFLWRCATWPN